METIIINVALCICILFTFYMVLIHRRKNNEIIENIKSRGHFVVEETAGGEQSVYYISASGKKTKYVPYKEEMENNYEESSTTEEPSTTTPPTIPPLSEITSQELYARMRYLESEINRLWHTILKIR